VELLHNVISIYVWFEGMRLYLSRDQNNILKLPCFLVSLRCLNI